MFDIFGAIKMVATPITSIVTGWQERKKVKLESDIAIAQAKTKAQINKIETGQKADIAWENLSINQSGWKDEWWTLILSIPMIMCFIPGLVDYVQAGFKALNETPDWYQYSVGVAIASAFGVRRIIDFMKIKKGD